MWKIYKILAVTAVTVFLLDLGVIMFFSFYRPIIHPADAIVVLGAAINTPAAYNRSLEALKLYRAGDAKVIVLAGGQDFSKAPTEAAYMEKVIESNSKDPVPLILDDQSHSTYENLINTKAQLGGAGALIIVSDNFHLARAVIMAKRLGFGPVYWSAPKANYYSAQDLVYYYGRETIAMLDYLPKFIFG